MWFAQGCSIAAVMWFFLKIDWIVVMDSVLTSDLNTVYYGVNVVVILKHDDRRVTGLDTTTRHFREVSGLSGK